MATTWSPTDNQQLTLSNGNLTASATSGGFSAGRTNTSWSAGKIYFEITINGPSSFSSGFSSGFGSGSALGNMFVGIANATFNLYNLLGNGSPSNSVGVAISNPQVVYLNNAFASNAGTNAIPSGNVIGIAADYTAKKFWYTSDQMKTDTGSGAWNNSLSSDPGSGLNGVDFSSQTGPFFGAWNTDTTGDAVTLNAIGPFHFGLPSGFTRADPTTNGVISGIQARQTFVGNGSVRVGGLISNAQSAQVLSASGTTSFPGRSGPIAATQDAETLTATGAVTNGASVYGPIIVTQGAETLSAAGTVTTVARIGTISATQMGQTLVASGFVGAISAPNVIWMD